ncbi:MAG: flagellar M-ring protein FliF [Treponema sp.]|jgi:flagellar M-ring protein FliF|nr:flagellar M-ring protein FliF [Treponema sp.]
MNEFLKKVFTKAGALWAGWSNQKRLIFMASCVVVLVVIVALFRVSSTPVLSPVLSRAITDEALLNRIVLRINQEDVKVTVGSDNIVRVQDEATARRIRTILIAESLLPMGIDPWEVFDRERWTLTDMERNVNFQRAQDILIADHIRAIHGVDNVQLRVERPPRELFLSAQNPVSASVTIFPSPGSDITQNRRQIEGIQRIIQLAVAGLHADNITITDHTGLILNDFEGMAAFDRLTLIEQERRLIRREEAHLRALALSALQMIYSPDRVRDLNVRIEMDLSKMTINTDENLPFVMRPRDPELPYDDSILLESVTRSRTVSSTTFRGTGFNPEGPAGVEGHVPPAFRDLPNLWGEMDQQTSTENLAINNRQIHEERSPSIGRVSVSVNVDGVWRIKHDAKGNPVVTPDGSIEREYSEVSPEELRNIESIIQGAVGYNSARGDTVVVRNIRIDRTAEFKEEDAAYFRQKQMQTIIIILISGLTLLLFGFMLFRMISREMERRKRIAEEERARREQMMRESAMVDAESDGTEVSISYEERTRMELMENAINMAKEHPDDAAQLIRTWLLEE